jgi:hypothetical protein
MPRAKNGGSPPRSDKRTARPKMGFTTVWVGKDDVPSERRYRSRINWVGGCGKDAPEGRLRKGVGSHVLKAREILNEELFAGS